MAFAPTYASLCLVNVNEGPEGMTISGKRSKAAGLQEETKAAVEFIKKQKQEAEHSKLLSDIPPELLELILQRLTLTDYLQCRAVCSSWRAIISDAIASRHFPPKPQLPRLLLSEGKSYPFFGYLLRVAGKSENTDCRVMRAEVPGTCLGSVGGWLIFMDHTDIYFLNPVSVAKTQMPRLSFLSRLHRNYKGLHTKFLASSAPDLPDCLVVAYVFNPYSRWLAFCKHGDKSWTLIETCDEYGREMFFHDLAVHDNKIYAVTLDGASDFVMAFDVKEPNEVKTERLVLLDPKPVRSRGLVVMENGAVYHKDTEVIYVVKDSESGEIMLVFKLNDFLLCPYSNWMGTAASGVKSFRLFKLDKSGPRWTEVSDLGDRSLFLSIRDSKLISTANMDGSGDFVEGNCIYFAFDSICSCKTFMQRDIGVFSLKDKSFKRFPQNHLLQNSARSMWFSPSPF